MKRSIFLFFKKSLSIAFLLLFVFGEIALGEKEEYDVRKAFEQGNVLYQKEDYAAAIKAYEEILSRGVQGASLYYNLGNAYFKVGQIGKAVLNYERALKFAPEDKELMNNLTFVHEFLQDKVEAAERPHWQRRLMRLHHFLSLNLVVGMASLCYILTLLFSAYAVIRPSFRPIFFRRLLVPLASLFVLLSGFGVLKVLESHFSPAIVITEEIDVRYGPSPQETKAFVLHAGTKCSVRDVSGEWILIWLPNDRGGWVHQSGLERI
ncbi:MAG: tetratricopeptide repeat protein [Candidatus Omnitrophica bacterium]|nr:tetratricopeptide repeat protein [Candidatus Omnitrophota bacterium]